MKTIEQVAAHFKNAKLVGKSGTRYKAQCPVCEKQRLSVWKATGGSIGVDCKDDDCHHQRIIDEVGLTPKDLYPKLVPGRKTADGRWAFSRHHPRQAAEAFVEDHQHDGLVTLLFHEGEMHRWQAGGWSPVSEEEFECDLDDWLSQALDAANGKPFPSSSTTIKSVRESIQRICRRADISPPCWLDGRDTVGVYAQGPTTLAHLHPDGLMELIETTPAFFTRTPLGFDLDPSAKAPEFQRYVTSLFDDDTEQVALLQEFLAYILYGGTDMQVFFVLHGVPGSGKSTLMKAVKALVGSQRYAALKTDAFAESNRFGAEELLGKRIGVVSDSRCKGLALRDTELLLSISGEDPISYERKHERHKTVDPSARLVFVTNKMPEFHDTTGAVLRRLVVLEFSHSFEGREDRHLLAKLLAELPGIGNWAYAGWQRLQKQRRFTKPESTAPLIGRLAQRMDPLGTFVRQACQLGSNLRVSKGSLLSTYNTYRADIGLPDVAASVLSRELTRAFPDVSPAKPRIDGEQIPHYSGIGLVPEPGEPGHFDLRTGEEETLQVYTGN